MLQASSPTDRFRRHHHCRFYFHYKNIYLRLFPLRAIRNSIYHIFGKSSMRWWLVLHHIEQRKRKNKRTGSLTQMCSTCSVINGSVFTTMCGGSFCEKLGEVSVISSSTRSNLLNRTLLSKKDQQPHPSVPTNTLSILERLAGSSSTSSFLTTTSSLEKPAKDGKEDNEGKKGQWWVEEMGKKPPKVKKGKGADLDADADDEEEDKIEKEDDEEDDWRKFFDEQNTNRESNTKKDNLGERIKGRKHTLTLHQSLHNTPSHRAAFTHAWLALLSRLSGYSSKNNDVDVEDVEDTKDLELAVRALNVMHRGVLPYLTRPVLVMDWIGACVDYGKWAF